MEKGRTIVTNGTKRFDTGFEFELSLDTRFLKMIEKNAERIPNPY